MGSLVVRCFCQKYDQDIDSLIVCGSPSDNPLAPIRIKIARIYSKNQRWSLSPSIDSKFKFSSF